MNIALSTAALAAPTDSNDVLMLDTTTALGRKMLPISTIKRISFSTEHSHDATLKAYRSIDGGTNWDLYSQTAITAPGATTITGPIDYLVDTYQDWKLVWTNGGTTQTTWRPEMHGHTDRQPGT